MPHLPLFLSAIACSAVSERSEHWSELNLPLNATYTPIIDIMVAQGDTEEAAAAAVPPGMLLHCGIPSCEL